jgi:serine phosphatase RsbU (regulator of sigma subunit)
MTSVPHIPLLVFDGQQQFARTLTATPFTIGRAHGNDLVLANPCVSREHARIIHEGDSFWLVDCDSRHGTFLNGRRVTRDRLSMHDKVRLGPAEGPAVEFGGTGDSSTSIRSLMTQLSSSQNSELGKLRWFLDAARRLNNVEAADQVLASLLETTLELTNVERGYVFMRNDAGELTLSVGRDRNGQVLSDDSTLSHTAIAQALRNASEFIVTDTLKESTNQSESVIAQNIRNIICIPLRSKSLGTRQENGNLENSSEIFGLLYLDDRLKAGKLTEVDTSLLRNIASEAAALLDSARRAIAEEAARRYREEMGFAARIQQGLMAVQLPNLPYAQVNARSIACKDIGGDFYDVIVSPDSVTVILTDVSGKGVSAALLASTLQGMIYAQIAAGQPLASIASSVNRYLCTKDVGKYATMVMLQLKPSGELEYINCGHVTPLLMHGKAATELSGGNAPVGLLCDMEYESVRRELGQGDRVLLVSDGVTEAEDASGEFFGDDQLRDTAARADRMEDIFDAVEKFRAGTPLSDDCTMVELAYTGPGA